MPLCLASILWRKPTNFDFSVVCWVSLPLVSTRVMGFGFSPVKLSTFSFTLKYDHVVKPIMPSARQPAMMKIEQPANGENFPVSFSVAGLVSAMAAE